MFMDKLKVFEFSLKNKSFAYLQDKCIEEISELIKAILKARERGEEHSDDIEQEFADSDLMMQQLRYCYDNLTDGEFSKNVVMYENAKCKKLWSIWHDGIIPEEK
jgi:hypothetical protein